MTGQAAGGAAVDAALTPSRTLVAVAASSLGAVAEETTIAQYRVLVVLASRGRSGWRAWLRLRRRPE